MHFYPVLDKGVIDAVRDIRVEAFNSYANHRRMTDHYLWRSLRKRSKRLPPDKQRACYAVLAASFDEFAHQDRPWLQAFRNDNEEDGSAPWSSSAHPCSPQKSKYRAHASC